jgi:hypothetical protein
MLAKIQHCFYGLRAPTFMERCVVNRNDLLRNRSRLGKFSVLVPDPNPNQNQTTSKISRYTILPF